MKKKISQVNRIREIRNKKRINQAYLARALSVEPQLISEYERGITPIPDETIRKIASILNVPINYLLCLSGNLMSDDLTSDDLTSGDLTKDLINQDSQDEDIKCCPLCCCPFCGEKAIKINKPATSIGYVQLICTNCVAIVSFKGINKLKEAAKAWNTRQSN